MSNINIFMQITNAFLPNLLITYPSYDYKNDLDKSALTSGDYIEPVDANLHPIDLLYPLRLSLLIEFYDIFIFVSKSYFILIEMTSLNQEVANSPDG
jgi:hypothetical protein